MLSCTVFDNSTSNAADHTGWFRDGNPPVLVSTNMINNTRNGNVVTSVLTVESVSLSDISSGYFCSPTYDIGSYAGLILVAGEYEDLCTIHYRMYVCTNAICTCVLYLICIIVRI